MPRNVVNYGDTPHVVRGVHSEWREIFQSNPEYAMTTPIQLMAGYGLLPAGTILAKNESAAGKTGYYLPYNPTTFTGAEDHPGRAYLVADSGTTASDLYVTIEDSYKFNVGDDVIINDDTTAAENLGAITAIDRTTETHRAKITVTNATGGTSFTTARKAYICVEAGVSANNYSDAVGILKEDVNTGTGQNSKGAYGSMIIGNALLKIGALFLYDSAAKTDLGTTSTEYGQYAYLK